MTKAVAPLVEKAVLVEVVCEGERIGWGSGVAMTAQTYLTAHHVVEDMGDECGVVVTHNGRSMPATIYDADESRDLATLFAADSMSGHRATVTREPMLGENVTCVGYGMIPISRDDAGVLEPIISTTKGNIATVGLPGGYVRYTAPTMPGSSGGGCFADDGALVLVTQAGTFAGRFPMDGMYYGRSVR